MNKSAKILIGLFVALAVAVVVLFVMKKKAATTNKTTTVDPYASSQELLNQLVIDQQNALPQKAYTSPIVPAQKIPTNGVTNPVSPIMDPSGNDALSFLGNDY